MPDLCKNCSTKCGRTQSTQWYAAGTQCSACNRAEHRERKRMAEQAEQKGKQSIKQMFAAAAAKKQKQQEDEDE